MTANRYGSLREPRMQPTEQKRRDMELSLKLLKDNSSVNPVIRFFKYPETLWQKAIYSQRSSKTDDEPS